MKRGWFSVDERLDEHPKWEQALEAVGPAAAGVWLLMVARCSRNLSDGHLTARAVRDIGKWQSKKLFEKTLDALLNARLIEKDHENGLSLVNYLDHQRSRASVEQELGRKAQNQQSYRDRVYGDRSRGDNVTGNAAVSNRDVERSVTALEKNREEKTREEKEGEASTEVATPSAADAAPPLAAPVLRPTEQALEAKRTAQPEAHAVAKRSRRGPLWHRVPDSWSPDEKTEAMTRAWLGVNHDTELQKFRDWEFKDPKSDADAAWRSWARRTTDVKGKPNDNFNRSNKLRQPNHGKTGWESTS
jgi:hypothetical protein